MKKVLFLSLFAALTLAGADQEIPKQFRVWGRKAPARLGALNPVPNCRGIGSIQIPAGYKKITPKTNLADPEVPEQFQKAGFIPFVFHPMRHVYDVTRPRAAEIGLPVRAVATPGEYVVLSFAVRTLKALNCVELKLSPFRNKAGETVIPQRNLDLRRVMDLPVPTTEEKQYLIAPKYLESFDEFDVLHLKADRTERFWLTVKVPENAKPGIVRAKFTFSSRNGGSYDFESAIRILPFKLAEPDPKTEMVFSMLANTNDPRFGAWGRNGNPDQINRFFVDMIEHGMNASNYEHVNPHVAYDSDGKLRIDFDRPGVTSYHSMNDFMHIIKRAGFKGPFCYYAGPYEWSSFIASSTLKNQRFDEKYNQALYEMAKALVGEIEKQKWPEFIFMLGDEPGAHADRVKLNLNLGRQMKKAAPHIKTSNFFNGEWGGVKDWKILKEVSDINCTNFVTPATVEESKKCGYKDLWLYNGIDRHADDSRGERLFFGFVPWKYDARGVSQYIYSAFDHTLPRDANVFSAYDQINGKENAYDYVYPSAEGPLPTPKWEAVRQGVYDYRYLLTLAKMIAEAPAPAAEKAKKTLDEVMANFRTDYMSQEREKQLPAYSPETLDAYRWKIARTIMDLQKEMK